jgi:hypothetical protein
MVFLAQVLQAEIFRINFSVFRFGCSVVRERMVAQSQGTEEGH